MLFLFFGNRVESSNIQIVKTRDGKFDSTLIEDVAKIGERSDTTVVP